MLKVLAPRTLILSLTCLAFACGSGGGGGGSDAGIEAPLPTTPPPGIQAEFLPGVKPEETKKPVSTVPTESSSTGPTLTSNGTVDGVPRYGTEQGLEIGTWNIENYPKAPESKSFVTRVLKGMDIDLMAVEEISGISAFRELVAELPGFNGKLATELHSRKQTQNVGFIYRQADLELVESEALFKGDDYAFPRPPVLARFQRTSGDQNPLIAIAVHLKAFGDESSQERREIANRTLQEYVTELQKKEPNARVIILGDFNQPILEDLPRSTFNPWFERADQFTVKTDELAQRGDYSFFAAREPSLIDHIIVSSNLNVEEPTIPKLQNDLGSWEFESRASDHLPVLTRVR